MHLLSAEICLAALREQPGTQRCRELVGHFQSLPVGEIAVSTVAKQELLFQAHHSDCAAANLHLVRTFLAPLVSLPFDERCAEEAALFRSRLGTLGDALCHYELLTMASARAFDAVMVVENAERYRGFSDVRIEAW